jgi:hypothetical protein
MVAFPPLRRFDAFPKVPRILTCNAAHDLFATPANRLYRRRPKICSPSAYD